MSKKNNIIVLFVIVLSIPAFSKSPMGSATVPVTHNQSGLRRSRNPIDTSGNSIVTGNVGGGRHFRGSVPYDSPQEFGDETSSSAFNSFRRRSFTSSNIYNTYTGKATNYYPYWSKQNKSTTRQSSIYQSQNYGINNNPTDAKAPSSIYQRHTSYNSQNGLQRIYGYSNRYSEVTTTPMTYNQRQGEKYTKLDSSKYSRGGQELTSRQKQLLQKIMKVDPQRIDDKAPNLRVKKQDTEEPPKSYKKQKSFEQLREQIKEKTDQNLNKTDLQENSFDKMSSKLSLLQKQLDQLQKKQAQTKEKSEVQNLQKTNLQKTDFQKSSSLNNKNKTASAKQYVRTGISEEDFDSFLENKFRQNFDKADNLLKNAKYYRAANAYTTAIAYNPQSVSALAGKTHALFGAGEYLSSSLFLARALKMNPDYARQKIDIVDKMGGRDIIETRIAEIEKWIKKSENPDLHFLAAYFYYRLDRFHKAQEHIDAAKKDFYDTDVYDILKKVIDETQATG